MDDLAETMLLNLLRGAGLDGLSPHVRSGTTPLLRVRRTDVRQFVEESGQPFILDPTNDDRSLRRNKIRHDVIPLLSESADRDIVPVLARQAFLLADEREWLDHATAPDRQVTLETADCRELATWPAVRLRRWLRHVLTAADVDGTHPPSAAEVARAERVVRGEVTACELSGGRRFARSSQRLSLQ
jgi:tRNA(Ile)-lysidine synthase